MTELFLYEEKRIHKKNIRDQIKSLNAFVAAYTKIICY